jgi:uncharacterized membrane protein
MLFSNFIMIIIIVIALVVMAAVLWFGIKHDPHNSIRSPESSRAVQIVQKQADAIRKRYEEASAASDEKS